MVWPAAGMYDANPGYKGKVFVIVIRAKQQTMKQKKTLVIGASENPQRYSHLAVQSLKRHQHPVVALGKKKGSIGNTLIENETKAFEDIDTVTLYLNPQRQQEYYDYILSLNPKRIIFNPGTENEALYQLAKEKGIQVQEACTLVLLSTGQY